MCLSAHRLLFQWASTIKMHLGMLIYYKADIIIILLKYSLFFPCYSWFTPFKQISYLFVEILLKQVVTIACKFYVWQNIYSCFFVFFNAKMHLKSEEQQMETTFIIFVKTTFCLCFRIHFFPQCLRMNYQKLRKPFWQQGDIIQMKTQCFTVSN